jgi:hypothetical protein
VLDSFGIGKDRNSDIDNSGIDTDTGWSTGIDFGTDSDIDIDLP